MGLRCWSGTLFGGPSKGVWRSAAPTQPPACLQACSTASLPFASHLTPPWTPLLSATSPVHETDAVPLSKQAAGALRHLL